MTSSKRDSACEVVMFQRRPLPGQHSLERVFADVRGGLPSNVSVTTRILPFESRGVANRLRNMLYAFRHRGRINHITGDVHYLALLLPKRSTILTVADLVSVERLSGLRRFLLVLLWYRIPVSRVGRVTVISEWTRQELVSLVPGARDKTTVVHCPVSPGFRPSPPPGRDRPVVLQVGTSPNKNLPRVLTALSGLPIHLRIIGGLDDSQLDDLAKSMIDFSQVQGISDDGLILEYMNSDIVLFASTYEGFGLPILEAQASGRPVITSSVASMPEVAGVGGALLVDPLDTTQIRRAVQRLTDDRTLYAALVQQGFENVKRFSPEAIAESYAAVYRTCRPSAGS